MWCSRLQAFNQSPGIGRLYSGRRFQKAVITTCKGLMLLIHKRLLKLQHRTCELKSQYKVCKRQDTKGQELHGLKSSPVGNQRITASAICFSNKITTNKCIFKGRVGNCSVSKLPPETRIYCLGVPGFNSWLQLKTPNSHFCASQEAQVMAQAQDPSDPCGRLRLSPSAWPLQGSILALAGSHPRFCRHLSQQMGDSPLVLPNKINETLKKKKNQKVRRGSQAAKVSP